MSSDYTYTVNPYGVLFHPLLDKLNRHKTLVYNWEKDRMLKVNNFGYAILRYIDKSPNCRITTITTAIASQTKAGPGITEEKIQKFLDLMVKENVVFRR